VNSNKNNNDANDIDDNQHRSYNINKNSNNNNNNNNMVSNDDATLITTLAQTNNSTNNNNNNNNNNSNNNINNNNNECNKNHNDSNNNNRYNSKNNDDGVSTDTNEGENNNNKKLMSICERNEILDGYNIGSYASLTESAYDNKRSLQRMLDEVQLDRTGAVTVGDLRAIFRNYYNSHKPTAVLDKRVSVPIWTQAPPRVRPTVSSLDNTCSSKVSDACKGHTLSRTLSYSMNFNGVESKPRSLIEVKCLYCDRMTCIGAGYCSAHLAEHCQLRVVRSRKNGCNAGLTIEAYNPIKGRDGIAVFNRRNKSERGDRICQYGGLFLGARAVDQIYPPGATREYTMEHSVRLSDGTSCLSVDMCEADKEDPRLPGIAEYMYIDSALLRSVGSLCNESRTPNAEVRRDPTDNMDWIYALRPIMDGEEIDIGYTGHDDGDCSTAYTHGKGIGTTIGLDLLLYELSNTRPLPLPTDTYDSVVQFSGVVPSIKKVTSVKHDFFWKRTPHSCCSTANSVTDTISEDVGSMPTLPPSATLLYPPATTALDVIPMSTLTATNLPSSVYATTSNNTTTKQSQIHCQRSNDMASEDTGPVPTPPPSATLLFPPVHATTSNNSTVNQPQPLCQRPTATIHNNLTLTSLIPSLYLQHMHPWHTTTPNSPAVDQTHLLPIRPATSLYPSAVSAISDTDSLPSEHATISNNSSNVVSLPILHHSAAALLYPPTTLAIILDTHDTITTPATMSTTSTVSHSTVAAYATIISPTVSSVATAALPTVSSVSNLTTNNSNSKKKKESTTTGQADNNIQRYFAPATPHTR